MGFGDGASMKLRKPNLRSNIIQDIENVIAGQTGVNSALLNNIAAELPYGVASITEGGQLVILVGDSFVGGDDVVGTKSKMNIVTS